MNSRVFSFAVPIYSNEISPTVFKTAGKLTISTTANSSYFMSAGTTYSGSRRAKRTVEYILMSNHHIAGPQLPARTDLRCTRRSNERRSCSIQTTWTPHLPQILSTTLRSLHPSHIDVAASSHLTTTYPHSLHALMDERTILSSHINLTPLCTTLGYPLLSLAFTSL